VLSRFFFLKTHPECQVAGSMCRQEKGKYLIFKVP